MPQPRAPVVWGVQPAGFLAEAFIDVDGTIAGTDGECKAGMGLSYKGIWGYAPLIVSLAHTQEVLYLLNRPGNVPRHSESVGWLDRAVALVRATAGTVTIRGDTDFSHTAHLDRWDTDGMKFILGLDAHSKVVGLARRIIYRILGYNDWLVDFFATFERIPWAGPLSGPAHSAHNIGPRDRGMEYSCVWPESRSAKPTEPITTPKRGKGVLKESCEGLQRGIRGRVSRMPVDWRQIPIPRRWFWG